MRCLARVGAEQHAAADSSAGLGAAVAALDQEGPNAEQARAFLRADARLLVVIANDEEDCTTADGEPLHKEISHDCNCLGDETQGGPLASVQSLADRLKSVKPDPAAVSVLAIIGDAVSAIPEDADAERALFQSSRCGQCPVEGTHAQNIWTYICHSDLGKAELGARYRAFAEAFGQRGRTHSICAPDGWVTALQETQVLWRP